MENDIFSLIADLEGHIENGKKVPFTSQYVVDRDAVMHIVMQMRDMLPEAIKEANLIIKQENRILQDARKHSDNIMAEADSKARTLRMESEQRAEGLSISSRQQAEEMVSKAKAQAAAIIDSAERQADDLVSQTSVNIRAEQQANEILTTARGDAQRTRMAVFDHCMELLKRAEDSAIDVANELRDARMQMDNER